ncbi:hypothetical protein B0H11DRAFT_210623 [Mycena galericulata]|nr:hypothetical protein B0H11DRAFT_210623 [Mycena galericulata]
MTTISPISRLTRDIMVARWSANAGLRKLRSYLLILRNLSVIRGRQTCFRIEKYVVIWFTSVHANILAWAARHYAIKVSKARVTSNAIFSLNHRIGSLPVQEGLQMYMARVDCYRQLTLDTDKYFVAEGACGGPSHVSSSVARSYRARCPLHRN